MDDARNYCISERYYTMNLLTENRHCEDDFVSSAHGDILGGEVVPAAVSCMRIVCLSGHWRVRCLCPHLPLAVFAVGSLCLLSIVPLVLPILTQCCAWLQRRVVCGHCGAPRWRMTVPSLAP
ncbi:surface protease GP63 [Trypanosoma cruzi]|nr:surface protease GP63 [Trypanosoma cruzi]